MKDFEKFIDGFRNFRRFYFDAENDYYTSLNKGQHPKAIVIACSDSRADPALLMGCDPGDIFVVRNVANLVPHADDALRRDAVLAVLEYGVHHLKVEHIIVLGHSGCGGIQALMNGDPVQISMHSNLIYSAFDPRFNVVSLPYLFDSVEDADAKLDGEAGQKMDEILSSYGLHCMGMAENGFRQLTNSVRPVHSVEDMKNLKLRVAGSNLLMKCYELWGADATNMNWSETYTALQQGTVDGQENPLPAIDAASVQEVQKYVSLWNANYDCLFFCINQDIYDNLTPEQQAVVDECGKLAVQYEREINRAGDDEILSRWQSKNGVEVVDNDELDIDSFKAIVEPVTEWYIGELQRQGYDDAEELVAAFK